MTERPATPLVIPLGPVEERFVRTSPGAAQQITTAIYVLDGGPLRDADGRLDSSGVCRHLEWWGRSHPYLSTRLVPSPLGLTPPAWVSAAEPIDRVVRVWPQPCPAAEFDTVAAGLQLEPLDLSAAPWHATVIDDPAGPVGVVMRAHHAWTDGVMGLQMLESLTSAEPSALRSPPVGDPVIGPTGALTLPWAVARRWWQRQPGWAGAVRSGRRKPLSGRARRFLGRHRWTLTRLAAARGGGSRNPPPEIALRWMELPLDVVQPFARSCGGNVNELLTVATAHALARVQRDESGSSARQGVLVPMSARSGNSVAANQVRVVPVEVDVTRPLADSVRSVRDQLRSPEAAPPVSAHLAHATTMLGPRQEAWYGPARVEQMALMPSLGTGEDFGVLALVRKRAVVVSVATRRPRALSAFADTLADVLSGRGPTTTSEEDA